MVYWCILDLTPFLITVALRSCRIFPFSFIIIQAIVNNYTTVGTVQCLCVCVCSSCPYCAPTHCAVDTEPVFSSSHLLLSQPSSLWPSTHSVLCLTRLQICHPLTGLMYVDCITYCYTSCYNVMVKCL